MIYTDSEGGSKHISNGKDVLIKQNPSIMSGGFVMGRRKSSNVKSRFSS